LSEKDSLEYELNENDILYFLHIPKTAGTSITNILENNFNHDKVFPEVIWPKLIENLPSDFSKYRLIRGHFGCWIYKLLPKTPVTITILRKPLEQTLSLYAHQLRAFEAGDPESIIKHKNETLGEIFEDPKRRLIFTNHQIRNLSLDFDIKALKNALKKEGKLTNEIRKQHRPKLPSQNQEDLLKIAKEHLMGFAFFGIAEKFEESLFLLYYTFGWFPVHSVPILNISPERKKIKDFSEEAANTVIKLTRFDEQLYEFAEKIFDERFKKMVNGLKEKYFEQRFSELSFCDMMYKMLEKHHFNRNPQLKIHSSIDYSFDQKIIGSGWHQREVEKKGRVFRWSGPETNSQIYFFLSGENDLKITVRIINHVAPDVLESLKLFVNESSIPLKMTYSKKKIFHLGGKTVMEGKIPRSLISNQNYTNLTFKVNKTLTPLYSKILAKDTRKMGLAFTDIEISAISDK